MYLSNYISLYIYIYVNSRTNIIGSVRWEKIEYVQLIKLLKEDYTIG